MKGGAKMVEPVRNYDYFNLDNGNLTFTIGMNMMLRISAISIKVYIHLQELLRIRCYQVKINGFW